MMASMAVAVIAVIAVIAAVANITGPGRSPGTDLFDRERDLDGPGVLECERGHDGASFLEGRLQSDKHDVESAGGKGDRLAGRNLQPVRQRAHLHHTVSDRHLVDLRLR